MEDLKLKYDNASDSWILEPTNSISSQRSSTETVSSSISYSLNGVYIPMSFKNPTLNHRPSNETIRSSVSSQSSSSSKTLLRSIPYEAQTDSAKNDQHRGLWNSFTHHWKFFNVRDLSKSLIWRKCHKQKFDKSYNNINNSFGRKVSCSSSSCEHLKPQKCHENCYTAMNDEERTQCLKEAVLHCNKNAE